jgi:putative transposase
VPWQLVTDKLATYKAIRREVFPSITHRTSQYENNRAEVSHQPTRLREQQMRRFKSVAQAQRFLLIHGSVQNLFRVGRHLLRSKHHRFLRERAFSCWKEVTCTH